MLINLFSTVRNYGVPATLKEFLDLLKALDKNLAFAGASAELLEVKVGLLVLSLSKYPLEVLFFFCCFCGFQRFFHLFKIFWRKRVIFELLSFPAVY